jgi:hypothetical protein
VSDLNDLLREMRLDREKRRVWGAGAEGWDRVASPLFASPGLDAPGISQRPPMGEPVVQFGSHTIALQASDQHFEPSGTAIEWSSRRSRWRHHGFFQQTFPSSALTVEILRYWRLDLAWNWDTWVRGGWVEVLINGVPQWTRTMLSDEWGDGFGPVSLDLGVLPVGTTVEVVASPGEAASGPKLATGIVGSLVAVDPPGVDAGGGGQQPPGLPTSALLQSRADSDNADAASRTLPLPEGWEPGDVAVVTLGIVNVSTGTFTRNALPSGLSVVYDHTFTQTSRKLQHMVGVRRLEVGDTGWTFGYSESGSAVVSMQSTVTVIRAASFGSGAPFGTITSEFGHGQTVDVDVPDCEWAMVLSLTWRASGTIPATSAWVEPSLSDAPRAVGWHQEGIAGGFGFPVNGLRRGTHTAPFIVAGPGTRTLSTSSDSAVIGRTTLVLPMVEAL